jgi:NAD(P)-dependent dehydrogenase (short-subunit alcohol dehydrogenase family)
MTAKSPVVLILGAGANIGQAVARTFASKGYKVALAARSLKETDSTDGQLNIPSDFSNSDSVVNAFAKVKEVFGIPSVVVYNGKSSFPQCQLRLTNASQLAPQPSPPPTTLSASH